MKKFIPIKIKIFNDRKPPWINKKWKQWFKIYQSYLKNKTKTLAAKFETLKNMIYETLESCKSRYYKNVSLKLCSKAAPPKYYWSLLKNMLNENKTPCLVPNIHDNKYFTYFSKKADLFLLKIIMFFLHQLILLPTSTCRMLNSRRMILKGLCINSILTNLKVMAWLLFACWKCPVILYLNFFSEYSKLLKIWSISRWLEKRGHYTYL